MPISCVLADDEIMLTIKPGEHGSTYGGNPIAAKVSMAALQVIKDEKLEENAERLGKIFRERMKAIKSDMVEIVRGKGLLNAVVITPKNGKTAWDVNYLRLDGVTIHHLGEEFKDMGKKKKFHSTKSIVDFADERIVSFEELEPEERTYCSMLSNLILGGALLIIGLIAGAV